MAAKKKQGKKSLTTGRWAPQPDDAIRLAALRWFALELERMSIEVYATDKTRFKAVEKLFRHTLGKLKTELANVKALSDDGCPDGFIRCKDGSCAPACDGIGTEDNDES